ncbi:hypothetical protein PR202_gb19063 [Eleusine coracana subsp. coracana]|uniref:SprT-like domain-containing protein n=1 Tax=Eleusine coracana subsp. coracana TaxID=191504 RepID=A0AAV5F8M5_ELECO|nr:hypothetical protein PR202_gb19063 [Eleusine coracana subsp. coracana]
MLFCDYNGIYFGGSLDPCAVCWAEDPLPDRGGCVILLSKSLYKCTNGLLKNVLLHEMIHAYICIKDGNSNHSDHGAEFQKLMNAINLSSVADPHRPVDGYSITLHHEIRKKYYDYKCESCGDLFKSIKMKGPSYDDCIEKIGADDTRSGAQVAIIEFKNQHLEVWNLNVPKLFFIISAEEALHDGMTVETVCKSWPPTSNKGEKGNKKEEDTSAEFLYHADDALGCSGLGSSSRKSNKKIKLSKDVGFDLRTDDIVQEVPKRPRTAVLQNQECSRRKKRKPSNWDGAYSVVIEWLNYYSVSDSDEDEVPLINKRTERRKRQKLIELSLTKEFSDGVKFASSTSGSVNGTNDIDIGSRSAEPGNDRRFAIVAASRPEERLLPNHEVAGDEAAHESVSSPLDSPIRGDIIDISDG